MQQFFSSTEYQSRLKSTASGRATSASTMAADGNAPTDNNPSGTAKRLPLSDSIRRKFSWVRKRDDNYMMLTEDHTNQHETYVLLDEVEMSATSTDYDRLGMMEAQIESGNSVRKSSNTTLDHTVKWSRGKDLDSDDTTLEIPTRRRILDNKQSKETICRRPRLLSTAGSITPSARAEGASEAKNASLINASSPTSLRRSATWQIPSTGFNHLLQRATTRSSNRNYTSNKNYLASTEARQAFPDRRTSRNYYDDPFIQAKLDSLLQNEKVLHMTKLIHGKKSK